MRSQPEILWDQYADIGLADVPGDAQLGAGQAVLDWFGCALYGSREPLGAILRAELATKDDDATIIGSHDRGSTRTAARINGAVGHALDYDDTNLTARFHATATVLPAVFALAEARNASGADLLVAYTVGIEIAARMRQVIGDEHYHDGWHQTATMGIFGAVAGAGWLLGLDAEQFANAIGFAASNAAGVHANFGTMTKPSHPGQAAEAGLLAAGLAKRGFTGNVDAFEAYAHQTSGVINWDRVNEIGDAWAVKNMLFKRYASGQGTQQTINGTKRLNMSPDDVLHAEIRVPVHTLSSGYGVRRPTLGLEAKFSYPGTMALTLLGLDPSDPRTFEDEHVQTPQFLALIDRIDLVGVPEYTEWQATIVVETPDGTRSEDVSMNRDGGWRDVPSRTSWLREKFDSLSTQVIGAKAKQLGDLLLDLPSLPTLAPVSALVVPD